MKDAPQKPRKIEALWRAICGSCIVAGYDFNLWKRSDPPAIDADPVIIDHPDKNKKRAP